MLEQYASKVEKLILRPDMMPPEVHKEVTAAMRESIAAVIVAPVWVAKVAAMLRGSGVAVGTVVGYPLGMNKATIKAIEASSSIKDGATEIEVSPYLPNVLSGDVDALRAELLEISRAARTTNREVVIKVACNAALLKGRDLDALLGAAAKAVRESGGDCLSLGAADQETVRKVRAIAEGLSIKVNAQKAENVAGMVQAGADRVGLEPS
jgi:deoxyribose-phosphate aldolase